MSQRIRKYEFIVIIGDFTIRASEKKVVGGKDFANCWELLYLV